MTNENQSASFDLTIHAESVLEQSEGARTLRIAVSAHREGRKLGATVTSNITVPDGTFQSEAQANTWAAETFRSFRARVSAALVAEAVSVAGDEANAVLTDHKIEHVDMRDVMDRHLKETEARLRERFALPKQGRPSQWTRLELLEALRLSASKLPKGERTIPRVFERLKETYPNHAPTNAAALRRALSRLKIKSSEYNWMGQNPPR
jgi:hypothetical protein